MKIRVGLLVGYNGRGYHGLQLNKTLNTIEKAISECLAEASAISKRNAEDPAKIHFKSSSRTDKGVHAALNLVSVKIEIGITEDLISQLRVLLLARKIHLYHMVKLTKSVIPSRLAESRIYEYIVPTFFLKKGDFNEEVKLLQIEDGKEEKEGIRRTYTKEDFAEIVGYRGPGEDFHIFNDILQKYVGTKNFHNFTNLSNSKGCNRYIKSITVSETCVYDDVEYIRISINGQSFLLHQIRKMIFYAVLLCKYSRGEAATKFERAFSAENMHIPKSPAEYLFLDKPIFGRLRRDGGVTEEIEINENEREEYKRNVIYPQIYKRENLVGFLASLDAVRFHRKNMVFLD